MTTEDWKNGIDEKALDKAISFGEIFPPLPLPKVSEGKTSSEETLYLEFASNPKKVENPKLPKGMAWFANVIHQGAKKNIVVPESLRFAIAKECKLHNLAEPNGSTFVIGATIQDMDATSGRPAVKGVKLYWAQYKPKGESEQVEKTTEVSE